MAQVNTKEVSSKIPMFIAYQVRNGKESESFWTRIGSAWQHADGNGYNIQLDAIPLDGRITLRLPTEKN